MPRLATGTLASIAAIKLALHLVAIGQYGYFRDELYYLASTEHLHWGYVDHPPLSIAILSVVRALLGESLFALRIFPTLCGVATVVLKLFQMVQPNRAYFGEKDYQQLQVVRKMVRDLNVPVEIVPCPTVREASGLALSSRNAYLTPKQRERASVLHRALTTGQRLVESGQVETERLLASMSEIVATEPSAALEYLAIVDPITLEPVSQVVGEARVIAAMRYHGVRLIDNLPLKR